MKKDDGFTFVETIAVVGIMLIMSAGVGLSISNYIEQSRVATVKNQLQIFTMALQSYYLDCGVYPNEEQGLNALFIKPESFPVPKGWKGPYVNKKISNDPWGNPYVYELENDFNLPFVIYSFNSDGVKGGEFEDIYSWQ